MDVIIDDSQNKRSIIIDVLMGIVNGHDVDVNSIDPKLLRLLLTALKDRDTSVFTSQRVKQEASDGEIADAHNQLIAEVLRRHADNTGTAGERKIKPLPDIEIDLVPGELS